MSRTQAREKMLPLNMRVESRKRNLIDMAVAEVGGDRTSFVIDAALRKAEEVLLDRRLFFLDAESFDVFEQAVNSTAGDNKCITELKNSRSPWDDQPD